MAAFTLQMRHEPRHRAGDETPAATELRVALAEPSADAAHLQTLLRERLAGCRLAAPTLELRLQCDEAPQVEVEGAAQAIKDLPPEFIVQLVGRKADIEAALGTFPSTDRARLEIVDAPEVVEMGEKPLAASREEARRCSGPSSRWTPVLPSP